MKSKLYISSFILLLALVSLTSAEEFGYNYLDKADTLKNLDDVSISNPLGQQVILYNQTSSRWYNSFINNSAEHVNASDYWVTGDRGSLTNVGDILHNWLDTTSLLWSNAGHIMDTLLDMNGNNITTSGSITSNQYRLYDNESVGMCNNGTDFFIGYIEGVC